MNIRNALLASACMLALSACGDRTADAPADTAATPAPTDTAPAEPAPAPTTATPAEPMPSTTPDATATPAPAPSAASDKPAATVTDCATQIEGNDAMQYNVGSITVPASCKELKITLKHTGTMPIAAMGHNVVVSKSADMQGVAADGMAAGATAGYIKAGDARVVAHSKMIGGGESTSVSVPVGKLKDGGPYSFFCSFPGHAALMKGTISVQ